MPQRFSVIPGEWAICRLPPGSPLPAWVEEASLWSATSTPDELSVVVPEASVPPGVSCERGWAVLKVYGPIPFSETGVLASLAQPLASAGVSIFAVSTFDTDYVLVRGAELRAAVQALEAAGHLLRPA